MWKKVERNRIGRVKKTSPSVFRSPKHERIAKIVLPEGFIICDRVDIYSDGNRLAFSPSQTGDYAVSPSAAGYLKYISIPSPFNKQIPFGTTDVELDRDGEMIVLDLDQQALAGATAHAAE